MKRKFQLLRSIEVFLWSVAVGLFCFYVSQLFFIHTHTSLAITLAVALGVAVAGGRKLHIFNIRGKDLAIYINHKYPQLEASADLLLEGDETLTSLQQLQKAKTIQNFEAIYPTINLPHHIGQAVGVLFLSALISTALTAFSNKDKKTSPASERDGKVEGIAKRHLPIFIKNALITITPPRYTGKKNHVSRDLNLVMPENSAAWWKIIFDGEVTNAKFI
ncbi:MAG TPA: hypothetical protein VJ184_15100, partial [Chryseolinea sp.]|nr:hypothetical protein [Chryseolinea sp.]